MNDVCTCVIECVSRAGELQDLLTCGDCLEEFPLCDIVRFIRHKVSHARRRCVTSSPPADDDDDAHMVTGDAAGVEESRKNVVDVSPSRGLLCDSSLPGDDAAAAADNRLNGDADDCFNDRSISTGQLSTIFRLFLFGARFSKQCLTGALFQ